MISVLWVCAAQAASKPASPVEKNTDVALKLQRALLAAEERLGALEPWQQKLFREEVVPQSQRFIRDFRQSSEGVQADIDFESIRNYLRLYGPKVIPGEKGGSQLLVLLRAEPDCAKCVESTNGIRKLVKERLERRGIAPIWATAEQVDPKLTGKALEEQFSKVVNETKNRASLVVEWKKAVGDDEDAAHADELKYTVRAILGARGLGKQEGQLEIFDTGNFEKTAARLLTDLFTEAGAQVEKAAIQGSMGAVEAEREGFTLEVSGIQGFAHYQRLKKMISQLVAGAKDKALLTVEESKIARGKAVFSVFTGRSLADVKALFSRLGDEMAEPGAGDTSFSSSVQVEVR